MGVLVPFSCRAIAPVANFFETTILTGTFLLRERVNDKQHDRDRDT